MNKIYRTVYNAATGTWIVASEFAKGRTKSSKTAMALAVAAALALPGGIARAGTNKEEDAVEQEMTIQNMAPSTIGLNSIGTDSIGTMATTTELTDLVKFGGSSTGAAVASGTAATALGSYTRATGNWSTAIGGATTSDTNGGRGAFAGGNNSVAIGSVSEARANNSVALGDSSLADRANTVSVGAVNNRDGRSFTRQIVNVAAGTQDNDAVNLGQMNTALSTKVDNTYFKANATGGAATASGANAIAIGQTTAASGGSSVAIGSATTAAGQGSIAIGRASSNGVDGGGTAYNQQIAIGDSAATSGTSATAIGYGAKANATNSMALGTNSVASAADTVSIGNDTTKRRLTNLAAGTTDTDAVNLGQMNTALATKVDTSNIQFGAMSAGGSAAAQAAGLNSIAIGRNSQAGAAGLNNATALGFDADATADGTTAIGARAKASGTNSVAVGAGSSATADNTFSIGNTTAGGQRRLVNLAAGTADTDAANVGQLNTVATTLNTRVDGIDTRVTTNTTDIGKLTTRVDGHDTAISDLETKIGDGSVGLVQQAGAGANLTVGKDTDGTAVDFAGTAGARTLTGVAKGDLSDTSTDAVNGAQLHDTNEAVAKNATDITNLDGRVTTAEGDIKTITTNVTNLDGRMTTAEGNITNIRNEMNSGTIGLVQQDASSGAITVAATKGGTSVDFAGTDGTRTLTGISNGRVEAGSTDAVTGDQLHSTNETVAANMSSINTLTTNVTNLGDRMTTAEGNITNIRNEMSSGTIGLVQQDATSGAITVAADKNGTSVDFAGTAGARTLTGVAKGELSDTSTDAVNGAQLHTTNEAVGKNTTDITNLDGRVTTAEGDIKTINTNVTNLDGRMTTAEGNITNIRNEMNSGTIGLVQQDATSGAITVAAGTGGTSVDFTGTAGARKLTGIAEGDINATSTDAVTGSQLHATNTNVTNLSTRVDGIDTRVGANETAITNIRNELGSGAVGLVQQDATTGAITVAANSGGTTVSFAGTGGNARKLTGVAEGALSDTSDEAVNGSQLHATNKAVDQNTSDITNLNTNVTKLGDRMDTAETNITNLKSAMDSGTVGLVQQDATSGNIMVAANTGGTTVNFAGAGGATRVLTGLSNGVVAAGSTDAITGDQLHTVKTDLEGKMKDLSGKVDAGLGDLEKRAGDLEGSMGDLEGRTGRLEGSVGDLEGKLGAIKDGLAGASEGSGEGSVVVGKGADASGKNSSAIGDGAVASGENSSAIGQGSVASGNNSSAIGQGAVASGNNSSAVGQGSSATGNNAVALGAGSVADRDNAVSVGAAGAERQITNVAAGTAPTDAVNVQQMNDTVRSARQDAMGGVAAAMAIAGLPQSSMPGKTFMALSGSTYGGEQGMAVGASYMTKDGKWVVKGAVNTSTRGEVGAVVGGGFYW